MEEEKNDRVRKLLNHQWLHRFLEMTWNIYLDLVKNVFHQFNLWRPSNLMSKELIWK